MVEYNRKDYGLFAVVICEEIINKHRMNTGIWLRIGLPLVRFFAVAVNFVTGTMMNYCFVVLVAKVDLRLADRAQR